MLSRETRGRLLALADDLAIHQRFDSREAISVAVAAMLDGVDSEAVVLVASEPESDPPSYLDLEPLVRQMLDDAEVGGQPDEVAGWGIVWREAQKLTASDERSSAVRAIVEAFSLASRPDEVWWLYLADDESIAIPDQDLEPLRTNGIPQRGFYAAIGLRLQTIAAEALGL